MDDEEFLTQRGIGPVAKRRETAPTLPYRHDLLIRVTVADDGPTGEHGYIDVAARLATLIAGLDPHVVDVASLPVDVVYLGKTDDEVPDPLDRLNNLAAKMRRRHR